MPIVESRINTNDNCIVRDCQDLYIEVDTEDLAEQIELIEKTQVTLNLQIMRLNDLTNY